MSSSISLREVILGAKESERDAIFYPQFAGRPSALWEVRQLLEVLGFRGERTTLMARRALANYSKLKTHGIYSRVVWNYKTSKWSYLDGLAERKIIRDLLVKAGEQL